MPVFAWGRLGEGWKEGLQRGGRNGYVPYLDCGKFHDVYMQNIKYFTLSMYSLLLVNKKYF